MNKLLDALNPEQREVATTFYGPVLILAGAGSGKTRALTHRIAHMIEEKIASPHEILAVTFTNKAAKEMRHRVGTLIGDVAKIPAAISTFHGLGAKLLREITQYHNRPKNFTIADTKDSQRIVKEAMLKAGVSPKQITVKTAHDKISMAKNKLRTPQDLASSASPTEQDIGRIFAVYEKLLVHHGVYDFDDLLLAPLAIFEKYPDVQAAYQKRWRFLSVDEYQDTNGPQEKLLRLLLGPEKNICAVGDDYQAIYSWRGGSVDHILHFERSYPNCKVIYLTQNYRSTPAILSAANQIIAVNTNQKHKKLWTDKEKGLPITLAHLQSETQETSYVVGQIREHQAHGGRLSDCVVLYRTNAQSRAFEEEFLTQRIPYTIVGGFRFYQRKEIRDALALLTLLINPSSVIAFRRLAESYMQGIGPKTIQALSDEAGSTKAPIITVLHSWATRKRGLQRLVDALESAKGLQQHTPTVADLLSHLLTKSGYLEMLKKEVDAAERLENIQELLNVTALYTDAIAFLEEVALLSDLDTLPEESDRVTCMTIHAAKGLEFPLVFVAGLEEGLLPHMNSLADPSAMEEERRLMYVAMTRAKQRLVLTHVQSRSLRGETTFQIPSRFLKDLPPETLDTVSVDTTISNSFIDPIFSEETIDAMEDVALVNVEKNDFVHHAVFGRGIVIDIQGAIITCIFEQHGLQSARPQEIKKV